METSRFQRPFDVIVVGAGVMGSAAAYQTARRGLNTLLLEQFDFLHHRGSSHGESRTTRVTYPQQYYPKMVLESSRLWEEAQAEAGFKVYFKTRHVDMGPSQNELLLAVIESCQKNSIPITIHHGNQLAEEFSGIFRLPEDWLAVINEHGGVIKPTKAVAMFQTLALRHGAILKDNKQVIEIYKDPRTIETVIRTADSEEFRCRKCVITAGAWTRKLIGKVSGGLDLPVQPLETTVMYWKIKDGADGKFTIDNGFPTFASYGDPYIYGTPSLEFPGLIKIPVHGGVPCDPEKRTWEAPESGVEAVSLWIKDRFGELVESEKPVMTQSCLYSMTPDEDFVIDFIGGEFGEDGVVCAGFSGHGFKMAPLIGRIVADLVERGSTEGVDLNLFKLGRFQA